LGAAAVAAELGELEPFDSEVGRGIHPSLERHHVCIAEVDCSYPRAVDALEREARHWSDRGAFVFTLGGEHTVSLGPLKAAARRWGELGIVQLDAHGDLRDEYEGLSMSHACVMRRAVSEIDCHLLGIGIRSLCPEEASLVASSSRITHLRPRALQSSLEPVRAALEGLPRDVYLTIDMDAYDPTAAPGVGTPEPGGLEWYQVADIIDLVAATHRIIGADLVELAPTIERARTVRLAARTAIRVLLRSLA